MAVVKSELGDGAGFRPGCSGPAFPNSCLGGDALRQLGTRDRAGAQAGAQAGARDGLGARAGQGHSCWGGGGELMGGGARGSSHTGVCSEGLSSRGKGPKSSER